MCEREREWERQREQAFPQGLQMYSKPSHHLFLVAQWSKNKLLRMDRYLLIILSTFDLDFPYGSLLWIPSLCKLLIFFQVPLYCILHFRRRAFLWPCGEGTTDGYSVTFVSLPLITDLTTSRRPLGWLWPDDPVLANGMCSFQGEFLRWGPPFPCTSSFLLSGMWTSWMYRD